MVTSYIILFEYIGPNKILKSPVIVANFGCEIY